MRRSVAVLFVVLACALAAFAGEQVRGPRIHVPEPQFDFGTVAEGERQEHLFRVQNRGNEDLVIRRVQPS